MSKKTLLLLGASVFLTASLVAIRAQQPAGAVKINDNDIGGVVTSSKGPEAGVWVIAETTDLPTRYIKKVVTDDRGRYLIPALPKANYTVWARGYGLVDSPKVKTVPGKQSEPEAVDRAQTRKPRRNIIRRIIGMRCWSVRRRTNFRVRGRRGTELIRAIKSQAQWLRIDEDG